MNLKIKCTHFLKKHTLPTLTLEYKENQKSPFSIKKLNQLLNNLPTKKTLSPDGFTCEFSQTFKEAIKPIL